MASEAAPTHQKAGWLTKKGHFIRSWKKRWFVLDGILLKYWKVVDDTVEDGTVPTLSELKGCINLAGSVVTSTPQSESDGRSFCFTILPLSKKNFLISAVDEVTRDSWIAAIRANVLGAGAGAAGQGSTAELPDVDAGQVTNEVAGADSGVTLGDFELLKVIGRGTYGKVMQVRRQDTGEIFAMKVLKKENIFARNDPKDLQHTIAERNVLALVNQSAHPFLLGLKFAFHTPAKLYYVLNFCNGGDLYYLLSRVKKFKESQARFYTGEVFLALQHLHGLGVIYRDLKPENVLLDMDGHVKLTDFGLSKESETADTFCGTPVYLAPEIWQRKVYNVQVDWWSLGCVLYEMVVGLPPFWGDTIKDVYKKVMNTLPKFPQMSAECQTLIEGLLRRDATMRLGVQDNGDDIKTHAFFQPLVWDELLQKQIRPPFMSKSKTNETDTNNFHKAFTTQRPIDSVANPSFLNEEQQAHFEGFTYVPNPAGGVGSGQMASLTISDNPRLAAAAAEGNALEGR